MNQLSHLQIGKLTLVIIFDAFPSDSFEVLLHTFSITLLPIRCQKQLIGQQQTAGQCDKNAETVQFSCFVYHSSSPLKSK